MFIQTEQTPNPATLKFLAGQELISSSSANFASKQDAKKGSPLAFAIFEQGQIKSVFFGKDFIAITKIDEVKWFDLKAKLLGIIIDHLSKKLPVLSKDYDLNSDEKTSIKAKPNSEDEIVKQIEELITTKVAPAVAQDGGYIEFCDFDDGIVYLALKGACEGCPSAEITLKMGIENMLKYYIPEVLEVRQV